MSSLYIYAQTPELYAKYKEYLETRRSTDSGVDLFLPKSMTLGKDTTSKIGLGIVVAAKTYLGTAAPSLLLPRSSISKTPLRLANSIGLVDSGYRGELAAAVDSMADTTVDQYDRLFQLCAHDFLPFAKIVLVEKCEDLPAAHDTRGAGGFGSTGR